MTLAKLPARSLYLVSVQPIPIGVRGGASTGLNPDAEARSVGASDLAQRLADQSFAT